VELTVLSASLLLFASLATILHSIKDPVCQSVPKQLTIGKEFAIIVHFLVIHARHQIYVFPVQLVITITTFLIVA